MTDEEKTLDLRDASDENVQEIKRGIDTWRKSGEGMHMILDSTYKNNLAKTEYRGMVDGLFTAGGGILLAAGFFWVLPKIAGAAEKIFNKFKK